MKSPLPRPRDPSPPPGPVVLAAGPLAPRIAAALAGAIAPAELVAVPDAAAARSLLRAERVDLLVLDQALGGDACETLLSTARSADEGRRVHVIFCLEPSANPTEARGLVARFGIEQLLVHPVDAGEVARRVISLLGIAPAASDRGTAESRVHAGVASLWDRFGGTMRERLATVEQAVNAAQRDQLSPEARREAERDAHRLAGSLGMFGLPAGSSAAREVERMLTGDEPLGRDQIVRLAALAGELRSMIEAAGAVEPDPPASADADGAHLLVVGCDPVLVGELSAAAAARGLRVTVAADLPALQPMMGGPRPDVAVVDLSTPSGGGRPDGYALLQALASGGQTVPVVALTSQDQLLDRVRAAKLGARLFLRAPLAPDQVLTEIELLLRRSGSRGCRVLLVDDDAATLSAVRSLLEGEGMRVSAISNPLEFWSALEAFAPDLIVLDLDMPVLGGLELCRVVRGDGRWKSVPVLFLTSHDDAATVQRVFAAGADDFVSKPVVGPELLTRIQNRLERQHLLRSLADTDALTGTANRRKADELLEQLRRLAERHGQPLSLVLLDLDGFKAINDQYGHAAGDQVLRQLSALLQARFRGEDVIGRWGGEEFVLGMYGMSASDAQRRLAETLTSFSSEPVESDQQRFIASFSAGVAEYPRDGADLPALLRAADAALYRAKAAGKRQVATAGSE